MESVDVHQPQSGQGGAPPWSAPPDNVIPGAVALQAVMAASSKAVVLVSVLWACPVGFWYGLSVRLRDPQPHGIPEIGPFFQPRSRGLESGSVMYGAGEQFHFTVAFADGRTPRLRGMVTAPSPDDPEPDSGIAHRELGGGGTAQRTYSTWWVWPLPPPGPISFLCSWPAMAIGDTCVEMDSGPIREGAARALVLWPQGPGYGFGNKRGSGSSPPGATPPTVGAAIPNWERQSQNTAEWTPREFGVGAPRTVRPRRDPGASDAGYCRG